MRELSRRLALTVTLVALAFTGTGCGKDSIVKDVKLRSYNQEGDAFAEVKAVINVGGAELPSVNLPIFDPRNPAVSYGAVSLNAGFGGLADLGIAVNLTEVATVPSGNATLPNGTALPIGGLDVGKVISVPLANTNGRFYVAVDSAVAVLGTAIPIKEMDPLGKYGGGANLFSGFTFKNGVRGIAGIFTSPTPGKNGFGIFVDASSIVPKPVPSLGFSSSRFALFSSPRDVEPRQKAPVRFIDQNPGASKERRINEHLYKLSVFKKRLTVQ